MREGGRGTKRKREGEDMGRGERRRGREKRGGGKKGGGEERGQ